MNSQTPWLKPPPFKKLPNIGSLGGGGGGTLKWGGGGVYVEIGGWGGGCHFLLLYSSIALTACVGKK